jgi:PIN domain nuclease of toxin-antitoxin system
MSRTVFDTSALLAFLWQEPGHEIVEQALGEDNGAISAANVAELFAKLIDRGFPADDIDTLFANLGLETIALDAAQAKASAMLRSATRAQGLLLGDRACLALARTLGAVALTADRAWLDIDVGVTVSCIRPDKH